MTDMPEDAETYLAQLERGLVRLPPGDCAKIVQEIRSHLAERAAVGPQMLNAAIGQLGAPNALARSFVDDWALSSALERGPAPRILIAILTRAWRSFAAVAIGTVGVLLYAFALAFLLIAVLKPITPADVGMWAGEHGGVSNFGAVYGSHPTAELLGWWIIPLSLALGAACYFAASLVMRHGGRLLLRKPG